MEFYHRSLCVVLSCVGGSLATGWSLIQGVVPYVTKRIGKPLGWKFVSTEGIPQKGRGFWVSLLMIRKATLGTWYYVHHMVFNPFNPKLAQIIFKNLVCTAKKTPHFTIAEISWLTLFKEIIVFFSENLIKHISTKRRVLECWSRWDV
jgi:hypothetical protein